MKQLPTNHCVPALGAIVAMAMVNSCIACDVGSIKGDFWFAADGTVQESSASGAMRYVPFAELGKVSYDGKGSASIVEIVAFHKGQSEVKATGTYTVASDCRGSVKWTLGDDKYLQSYAILVLQGGSEIQTIAFRASEAGGSRPLSGFSQKKL